MNPLPDRRHFLLGAVGAAFTSSVLGQSSPHHAGQYESLSQPGRIGLPELAAVQHVFDSPAPKATQVGRWLARVALPLARSEMAWAVEYGGRMHMLGGYGEQRVDRAYHQAYDPVADRWSDAAPLPHGANHVGVAVLEGKLYAVGGHLEQNRKPHDDCFVFEAASTRWQRIAPLPRACGAIGCVGFGGRLHAIGGAIGDTGPSKKSVNWHLAYDPKADRWEPRNPLPTARSGHGAVLYPERLFVMGGEGTNRVFGQNEAWDPVIDRWESFAPMRSPRHGLGAAVLGDAIHVAGGGPVMGGGVQSALHEAFTLA